MLLDQPRHLLIIYLGMANTKPYVQVACVCEKVLVDTDKVPSLIRIVDTYHLQLSDEISKLPQGIAVALTAFVSIKSGDVKGQYEIGLVLRQPDGKSMPRQVWPVVLTGDEQGVNLQMNFALQNPQLGLYWFDVIWENEILTSIPFRLKRAEVAAGALPTLQTTKV